MKEANPKPNNTLGTEVHEDEIILKKPFARKTFEERLAEYDGVISVQDFDWKNHVGMELF